MYVTLCEKTAMRVTDTVWVRALVLGYINHGRTCLISFCQSAVCLFGMLKMLVMYLVAGFCSAWAAPAEIPQLLQTMYLPVALNLYPSKKGNILHLPRSENRTEKILCIWMRMRDISNSRRAGISNWPADENGLFPDPSNGFFSPLAARYFERRAALSEYAFLGWVREEAENPANWDFRFFRTIQGKREERSSCIHVYHLWSVISSETLCLPCYLCWRSSIRWMLRKFLLCRIDDEISEWPI